MTQVNNDSVYNNGWQCMIIQPLTVRHITKLTKFIVVFVVGYTRTWLGLSTTASLMMRGNITRCVQINNLNLTLQQDHQLCWLLLEMNFPMIMHRTLTVFGVGHANDEVNILIENNPIYSCNSMFSMADYSTDSQLPLYSCNVPPNNNNQIVYYN